LTEAKYEDRQLDRHRSSLSIVAAMQQKKKWWCQKVNDEAESQDELGEHPVDQLGQRRRLLEEATAHQEVAASWCRLETR
jgi:hypothetical protein